jgi:SET domain
LTINYGNWKHFDDKTEYKRPIRSPAWLEENGWCIDHLEIKQSTIPGAGRGAFVKRNLAAGTMVAPAPLQAFEDRKAFQYTNPEQLYVNYCLQPRNSKMMFFPYGPGVNLINHASSASLQSPNVGLRWSKHSMHRNELLDMEYEEFWSAVEPGHLILEFYALRDLVAGEELLLDYGSDWQASWDEHVANWTPPTANNIAAESYVYPEDMDDTEPLRTVNEQETDPYPSNLITMCMTPDKHRKKWHKHLEWEEPERSWSHTMAFCHILERTMGTNGLEEYTVSLVVPSKNTVMDPAELVFDATVPMEDLYIDTNVPRRAIRWIEKPYMDDEHLQNAFRHPIGLPDDLVPDVWRNDGTAVPPILSRLSPKS